VNTGLPGGGPWRILEDCPARLHNTGNAPSTRRQGALACICPHGVQVYETRKKIDNAHKWEQQRPLPRYLRNMSIRAVWLPGALCTTTGGRTLMDALAEQSEGAAAAVKKMCETCPALAQCASWILEAEQPGGSWGGYYAGMTRAERYERWKEKEAERGKQGTGTQPVDSGAGR
jgi:Transcription factor WhiB